VWVIATKMPLGGPSLPSQRQRVCLSVLHRAVGSGIQAGSSLVRIATRRWPCYWRTQVLHPELRPAGSVECIQVAARRANENIIIDDHGRVGQGAVVGKSPEDLVIAE
jgi:hypothetical protein